MRIVVIDYETYYADDYTLSKMSTEEYLRDPRFRAHGAAIKWQANIPARWYDERELQYILKTEDWSDTLLICHHGQFDHAILAWHYGVHPKLLGDTLAMARLLIGNHTSVSLDSVRKHFGIPAKTTPYHLFRNRTWEQLDANAREQLADGCCDEVESIWKIFGIMSRDFPIEEYEVVDTTLRMFVEPVLGADIDLLAKVWETEAREKTRRMTELNITEKELQSADKFSDLLRREGIEPETKPGKNGPIPAFAKTDEFMRELLEHDNERIRTLAEARLGAKSTLLQTRAETLGWMARRGPMPVYLRYCGAHTTRWSGGDGANWQNFRRGSDIRRAIMAPEGHLLAPIDLSQIEFRILSWLAGQTHILDALRRGEDPYIDLATKVYGFQVTKQHPNERGTGKQLKLSCGFQAGAKTIQNTARLGIYGPPVKIDIEEATRWRDIYREDNPEVVAYWAEGGRMISRLAGGDPTEWGPMLIRDGKIYGPGGTHLDYRTLEFYKPTEEEIWTDSPWPNRDGWWRYRTRHGWAKLYSGKLVENVVQWLARIVMSQAMNRIVRLGYRVVNTTHDELLILIPKDGKESQHLETCMTEMRRTPDWLPGIPLDCEGSLGERYSK